MRLRSSRGVAISLDGTPPARDQDRSWPGGRVTVDGPPDHQGPVAPGRMSGCRYWPRGVAQPLPGCRRRRSTPATLLMRIRVGEAGVADGDDRPGFRPGLRQPGRAHHHAGDRRAGGRAPSMGRSPPPGAPTGRRKRPRTAPAVSSKARGNLGRHPSGLPASHAHAAVSSRTHSLRHPTSPASAPLRRPPNVTSTTSGLPPAERRTQTTPDRRGLP